MGFSTWLAGKVHESETTQDAAIREVREKTGLAITPPELCGISEIIIRDPDETLLSHVIAYVYTYEIPATLSSRSHLPRSHAPRLPRRRVWLPIFSLFFTASPMLVTHQSHSKPTK